MSYFKGDLLLLILV